MSAFDPLSYSNTNKVKQNKFIFDVEIDLENEVIKGSIRIYFTCLQSTSKLMLDAKSLEIYSIKDSDFQNLDYSFVRNKNASRAVGRGLIINLKFICLKNTENFIDIYYSTNRKSIAVHFSHPIMLINKNYKFMYTHGPPIFSRTMFPCQDTPFAKVLEEAKIRINKPYTVLFSGVLQQIKEVDKTQLQKKINKNSILLIK